jgi:exosome complex component RRP41
MFLCTLPGVPMFDLVTSCTVGYADSTALLDVNYLEESTTNAPMLTIAVTPKTSKIVLVDMANKVSVEVFNSMLELAMVGCRQLSALLDANMRDRTEALLQSRGVASS